MNLSRLRNILGPCVKCETKDPPVLTFGSDNSSLEAALGFSKSLHDASGAQSLYCVIHNAQASILRERPGGIDNRVLDRDLPTPFFVCLPFAIFLGQKYPSRELCESSRSICEDLFYMALNILVVVILLQTPFVKRLWVSSLFGPGVV